MAKIIFTTCTRWPAISTSDRYVANVLTERGHLVAASPWNGAFNVFTEADLVLLRSNWDYHYAISDFEQWLNELEAHNIPVQNSLKLVRGNLSKSYMINLKRNGINVPDSAVIDTQQALERIFSQKQWTQAVIKPIYGASGHLVELIEGTEISGWARQHLHGSKRQWLVQEFLPQIRQSGELSIIFFNGEYAHAVQKKPKKDEFRINSQYQGQISRFEPEQIVIKQARSILNSLVEIPLYARLDGVLVNDNDFCLLELELNEPGLYFEQAPEQAHQFAHAIEDRL